MQYGVCGDPAMGLLAKNFGFDYFEWSVGGLLHPREDESVFLAALDQVRSVALPCPVLNVFLPGDLKITGPEANLATLREYVTTAFRRALIAGVDTIVFGSGGARRIPDGFDRDQAWSQLVNFCKMLGPIAENYSVKIAIEPLNLEECNVLNTVEEAASLAHEVNHANIRLLVDGFHWAKDSNSESGVLNNAEMLIHAHIATRIGRKPPSQEDKCAGFLNLLRQSGYQGRISIEGNIQNPAAELPEALMILRENKR